MERITMHVDGVPHDLAQGQDISQVKEAVVQAAQDGAGMVTVTLVRNRVLDVLVTPGIPIAFESEAVLEDVCDDDDLVVAFDYPSFHDFTSEL
ncbi:hypothetical protein [Frigoribacterium sp. CFBP 8751]|uniref:hypothetical protein n=1 Tax=Frigoribacterium sp. CFBP 8751 TaxID=2775277 RepID=UPI001782837C|nr:hypothetical protein [Frigoribacterium sp. CFBP 8751]MBD8540622.1 hypothetical protein [Frigoribacterium sp. CFBP 8751]